jgi:hypothetical protein
VELAPDLVPQLLAAVHRHRPDLSAHAARVLVLRCVREVTERFATDAARPLGRAARARVRPRTQCTHRPRLVPALRDPPPEPPTSPAGPAVSLDVDDEEVLRAPAWPAASLAPMADAELGEEPFGYAVYLGAPQEWVLDRDLEAEDLRRAA